MKRSLHEILLWVVVLVSMSCSLISGTPAPLSEPAPLSKPTALSPETQSYDEAVAAQDDISVIKFIANELRMAELETPYSPFEICFEEMTQTVKTGANGKFTSLLMDECGTLVDGDFAISSTVILNSPAKTAACGYVFRSDEKGSWYELRLERVEGSSRWSLVRMEDGVAVEVLREPSGGDQLDLSDNAQTRVLLYARGATMKVFFNGSYAGTVEDSDLSAGRLSLFAEAESGAAICRYDSYWINFYHG